MASIIDRGGGRTAEEIRLILSRGLCDLSALGREALVPFEVQKLKNPSIVWMNSLWVLSQGIDMTERDQRLAVEQWIVDEFGYCIYSEEDRLSFDSSTRIMFADRYGTGQGMAPHGGSGRVAVSGSFQIKGIGATPLARGVEEWSYSHGCLWMEEAIREAILGEVAGAEFPHGSIPVVAILDTGLRGPSQNGDGERRALMVRPATMRPAHLERAAFFSSRHGKTELSEDIGRTRNAHVAFSGASNARHSLNIHVTDIAELISNLVRQVAYGQAHRLFHGGYFSSNIGINGELHDYGSFRALPDWCASQATGNSAPFGSDGQFLRRFLESYLFHSGKFGEPSSIVPVLIDGLESSLEQALLQELASIFTLELDSAAGASVANTLMEYFLRQQRFLRNLDDKGDSRIPWLYDRMDLSQLGAHDDDESRVIGQIYNALREHYAQRELEEDTLFVRAWERALRLLEPRSILFRHNLQGLTFAVLGADHAKQVDRSDVTKLVDLCLSNGIRAWPQFDNDGVVIAQTVTCSGTAVLSQVEGGKFMINVVGVRFGDRFVAFNQSVLLGQDDNITDHAKFATLSSRIESVKRGDVTIVTTTQGEVLVLPIFAHWYKALV